MSHEDNEFTHILYEIKMYILTYRFEAMDQLFTNLVRADHSIHLRNLAHFFREGAHTAQNWNYSAFVSDPRLVRPIPESIFEKAKRYSSGAVGHLGDERVRDAYKADTQRWEDKAFPQMMGAISSFIDALDAGAAEGYMEKWTDPYVRKRADDVRELCDLHSKGGGIVLSGRCAVNTLQSLDVLSDSSSARFYGGANGRLVPIA